MAGNTTSPGNNQQRGLKKIETGVSSTKNSKLKPKDVTPKSHKKAWWLCKKGHEWQARIADRSSKGNGCPYCSGRRKSIPSEQIQMLFY